LLASSIPQQGKRPATDYSQVVPLGRARADRSFDPNDWSPRDVLLDCLACIDGGYIDPARLIVVYDDASDPDERPDIIRAGPGGMMRAGMLAYAAKRELDDNDYDD
jgi:hypothetical protein